MWGTLGSGHGQFISPQGVAVNSLGDVFVVDSGNNRVQKFTSAGTFIRTWGTQGTRPGQFRYPLGLAVDTSGNVFVADSSNNRVQKFTNNGGFVTSWGTPGIGPGQIYGPAYLDVINTGTVVLKEYVYVVDVGNYRIQVFTWKPDVQPTTNLNLKGSLENNNTAVTSK